MARPSGNADDKRSAEVLRLGMVLRNETDTFEQVIGDIARSILLVFLHTRRPDPWILIGN